MAGEISIQLLRQFIVVAEELHFTRAAARLYLAQQALSRDVNRLESQLGVALFTRTTRRVALTPDGERLLPRAQQLVAQHDQLLRDIQREPRPLLVDVVGERRTPAIVLDRIRGRSPAAQLVARFGGGLGLTLPSLLAGQIDVAFGRAAALGQQLPSHLTVHLIRLEPLGLLVPDDHPYASRPGLPLAELRGATLDIGGDDAAPEWIDAGRQLARDHGIRAAPSHPHVVGPEETARHLRDQGLPILTHIDGPDIPGAAVRPLAEPRPLYPWAMVHRRDLRHPALEALRQAAEELAHEHGWLRRPTGSWLPEPERAAVVDT
jgi:DNA-binding transcriptional LysR family regulator